MSKLFKSVLHGNERGYRLETDWSDHWNQRGAAPLSLYLVRFDTYGDGMVQHSPGWCVQFADVTDACISIAQAILEDPLNKDWQVLTRTIQPVQDDALRFALSVKHEEEGLGCARYVSLEQRKITRSASKQHDKRFRRLEKWMDGSPGAAYSLVMEDLSHLDWLARLWIVDRLRELSGTYAPGAEILKPIADLKGDWHQAFRAYVQAVEAVRALEAAGRVLDCAIRNSTPAKPEQEPEAKAA